MEMLTLRMVFEGPTFPEQSMLESWAEVRQNATCLLKHSSPAALALFSATVSFAHVHQ